MKIGSLKLLTYLLLALSTVGVLFFLAYAGGGIKPLLSLFVVWTVLPFIILFVVQKYSSSYSMSLTSMILSILATLSLYLYFETLFISPPDAQAALGFLILPFFQLSAIVIGFAITGVVNLVRRKL